MFDLKSRKRAWCKYKSPWRYPNDRTRRVFGFSVAKNDTNKKFGYSYTKTVSKRVVGVDIRLISVTFLFWCFNLGVGRAAKHGESEIGFDSLGNFVAERGNTLTEQETQTIVDIRNSGL
jgi:hypothetical protein